MQRSGAGYRCQYTPNYKKKRDYSLDQIDLFAAYVIPHDAWYLIPAAVLLGKRRIMTTCARSSCRRRRPATATNAIAKRGIC